ncbi:hypothetical protein VTO73DRAFT_2065 [Trametes versicolor]
METGEWFASLHDAPAGARRVCVLATHRCPARAGEPELYTFHRAREFGTHGHSVGLGTVLETPQQSLRVSEKRVFYIAGDATKCESPIGSHGCKRFIQGTHCMPLCARPLARMPHILPHPPPHINLWARSTGLHATDVDSFSDCIASFPLYIPGRSAPCCLWTSSEQDSFVPRPTTSGTVLISVRNNYMAIDRA